MTVADIGDALSLWQRSEGVSLRDADSPEALTLYLERNPGASFVARDGPTLVGVSLAGHDGRRGLLHHVAVAAPYRRQGIGRGLVERCLAALKKEGVMKCHILVFADNAEGKRFWTKLGWHERNGLQLMSFTHPGMDNA
jgi:ribosomal protein S18 acetylase RimI-like enzyme